MASAPSVRERVGSAAQGIGDVGPVRIASRHPVHVASQVLAAVAVLVGGMLRVNTTGRGPFWRDEALFAFVMQLPSVPELLAFLYQHESHPPLFYFIMRGWASLFGTDEASLKLLPLILSISLIPAVYAVGNRAFGWKVGLVSCWLVAINPVLIFHSVQLRPYPFFALLALGSCFALWRLVDKPGWRSCIAYTVLTFSMLATHHWGWLILASQGVVLIAARAFLGRSVDRTVPWVGGAWAVMGTAYLPLLPLFLRHSQHSGHFPAHVNVYDAIVRLANVGVSFSPFEVGVAVLVLCFGVVAFRRAGSLRVSSSAYLFLSLVAVVAAIIAVPLSVRSNLLVGHTMTALVPFVSFLIACGLVAFWTDRRWASGGFTVLLLLSPMVWMHRRYPSAVKSNARDVANAVAAHIRPDDLVIIAPDRFAPSFNYYFRSPVQQIGYPYVGRQETLFFDDWYDRIADPAPLKTAVDTINAFRARGSRVWLIVERGMYEDSLPNGLVVPKYTARDAYRVEAVRVRQIDLALRSAYGKPDTMIASLGEQRGVEILRAILYSSESASRP